VFTLLVQVLALKLGGMLLVAVVRLEPDVNWLSFLMGAATLWLTWRYEQAPALAQFRRENHETLVDDFARLDRRQWRLASERIAAREPHCALTVLRRVIRARRRSSS
jgi:hypothetical protein